MPYWLESLLYFLVSSPDPLLDPNEARGIGINLETRCHINPWRLSNVWGSRLMLCLLALKHGPAHPFFLPLPVILNGFDVNSSSVLSFFCFICSALFCMPAPASLLFWLSLYIQSCLCHLNSQFDILISEPHAWLSAFYILNLLQIL